MDVNSVAKEYISQRFQSLMAASMVTCLKNHSRFLSVRASMEDYSPKVFGILTKYCEQEGPDKKKGGSDFRILDDCK